MRVGWIYWIESGVAMFFYRFFFLMFFVLNFFFVPMEGVPGNNSAEKGLKELFVFDLLPGGNGLMGIKMEDGFHTTSRITANPIELSGKYFERLLVYKHDNKYYIPCSNRELRLDFVYINLKKILNPLATKENELFAEWNGQGDPYLFWSLAQCCWYYFDKTYCCYGTFSNLTGILTVDRIEDESKIKFRWLNSWLRE